MKRILLLLFCFLPGLLFADNVTVEKAQSMASRFLQSTGVPQTRNASLRMVWNGEDGATRSNQEPAFYVFNNEGGRGFVVVAGDDLVTPILGYSLDDNFDANNIPVNMRSWLLGYRDEINFVRARGLHPSAAVAQKWGTRADKDYGKDVKIHATALWDQGEPYWNLCPKYNNTRCYTGCVITAMCIVMRHHQWPDVGVGEVPAYTTDNLKIKINAIKLGHKYNWSEMPMNGKFSATQTTGIATLMRDVGAMVKADYGTNAQGGTGAYTSNIPYALRTFMKYDKSIVCRTRDTYPLRQWIDMVKAELDRCPIIYSGANSEAGHAFVFDGYTDKEYFHVNWGWSGYQNGYFKISALDPGSDQGAGGSNAGYNSYQDAIFNMKKDAGGAKPDPEIRFMQYKNYYGLTTAGDIEPNKQFTVQVGFCHNTGDVPVSGRLKFALVDKDEKEKEVIEMEGGYTAIGFEDLKPGYGYNMDRNLTIKGDIAVGDRIRMYYQFTKVDGAVRDNDPWKVVYGSDENGCQWEILTDVVCFDKFTAFSYQKDTRVLMLKDLNKLVNVKMLSSTGADKSSEMTVESNPTSKNITIDTKKLEAGTYTLEFTGRFETETIKFTVGENK